MPQQRVLRSERLSWIHGTGTGLTPAGSLGSGSGPAGPSSPSQPPSSLTASGADSPCAGVGGHEAWQPLTGPQPPSKLPPAASAPTRTPLPGLYTSTPLLHQLLRARCTAGTGGPSLREVGFTGTLGQGWGPRQISRSGTSSPISQVLPRLSPAPSAQLSPIL